MTPQADPIYILVDQHDTATRARDGALAGWSLPDLVERLRQNPGLAGQTRLGILRISGPTERILPRLAALNGVPQRPARSGSRPRASTPRTGQEWIGADLAELGGPVHLGPPPRLLLVADRPGDAEQSTVDRSRDRRASRRAATSPSNGPDDEADRPASRRPATSPSNGPGGEADRPASPRPATSSPSGPDGKAGTDRAVPDPANWDRRDTVLDGVCLRDRYDRPAVELRAASVRGAANRLTGQARRDDYAYRCTDNGRYLVAAVCDGGYGGRQSHRAAALVARRGTAAVASMLAHCAPADLDWTGLATCLADEILRLTATVTGAPRSSPRSQGRDAGTLATAAVFAVVDLTERATVHVFSVGSPTAWILRGPESRGPESRRPESRGPASGSAASSGPALSGPTSGGPASHGSVSDGPASDGPAPGGLGGDVAGYRWERLVGAADGCGALPGVPSRLDPPAVAELGPADVLVLMTDGLGEPLGDGTGDLGRYLADVWTAPPAPLAYAAQVDVGRDDRTALALWPRLMWAELHSPTAR